MASYPCRASLTSSRVVDSSDTTSSIPRTAAWRQALPRSSELRQLTLP
jgi:hypothetical protein